MIRSIATFCLKALGGSDAVPFFHPLVLVFPLKAHRITDLYCSHQPFILIYLKILTIVFSWSRMSQFSVLFIGQ